MRTAIRLLAHDQLLDELRIEKTQLENHKKNAKNVIHGLQTSIASQAKTLFELRAQEARRAHETMPTRMGPQNFQGHPMPYPPNYTHMYPYRWAGPGGQQWS